MATPMAMPVPGIQAERDHALDWVKWLALVAMVLDHLWFVLPAEWQDPGYGLRVAGRLAFPLFCLAIAANVARQPAGFPVGIGRYLGFQAGTGVWGATEQKVHLSPAPARKPLWRLVSSGKPSFCRTLAGTDARPSKRMKGTIEKTDKIVR